MGRTLVFLLALTVVSCDDITFTEPTPVCGEVTRYNSPVIAVTRGGTGAKIVENGPATIEHVCNRP